MRPRATVRPILLVLPAILACQAGDLCTTSVEPSMVLHIRDAETGASLAAGSAGRIIRRGGVTRAPLVIAFEPVSDPIGGSLPSRTVGHEVAGIFEVEVEHPGYRRWSRERVQVRRGACHVETAALFVDLERE